MIPFSIQQLIDIALPRQCLLCGIDTNVAANVCPYCQAMLPKIVCPCHRCGIEMHSSGDNPLCFKCIKAAPKYNRCIPLYRYEAGAKMLITDFKFGSKFAAGEFLANELALSVSNFYRNTKAPNILVPVPLHISKLARRGFNQSLQLARGVAKATGIPLADSCLKKNRATPAQSSLSTAAERRRNLRGSFSLKLPFSASGIKSVALIDDVVTTQATINEISEVLVDGGFEEVNCFCVARAQAH